jgi:hypothetical protein
MADPVNRLTSSLRKLIAELFPKLDYFGVYRYTATACDYENQTVDARPASSAVGLPALAKIPIRSWIKVEIKNDTSLGIGFLDGDPTQPYLAMADQNGVVARAKIRADGVLELGENAAMQVARQGDLTVTPLLGVQVMFAALPTGDLVPSPMMTMTPYFIAAGSVLTTPPSLPVFPLVGQFVGFSSSGSQLAKVP